jgi:hypothetical protein
VSNLAQTSAVCSEEGKSEVFIEVIERPGEDPNLIRINGTMIGSSPGSIEQRSDLVKFSVSNEAEPINSNANQAQISTLKEGNYIQNNSNFSKTASLNSEITFPRVFSQNQAELIERNYENQMLIIF